MRTVFSVVTVINPDFVLVPGASMSRKRPGYKRKQSKPAAPPTVREPDGTREEDFDRALKMGMIMDPRTVTPPEEIERVTNEMVALDLLEPVMLLNGPAPGESYGPTKEFMDAFLAVRKQYLAKAKGEEEKAAATTFALSDTVRHILELTQPNVDRAVMIVKHMDYYYMMAVYMSMSDLPLKNGFDPLELYPAPIRKRQMERRAKEGGRRA
jgi:hypothetical protein